MLITPAIQADWKDIGVRATLIQNEAQIAYDSYKNRDFQVATANWTADFDDPITFLGLMLSNTGQQNYSDYSNPAYDALLARAGNEPDVSRRASVLGQAEQLVLDDASIAPIYFTVNRDLVSPAISGWVDNIIDIHRARYLCVRKRG